MATLQTVLESLEGRDILLGRRPMSRIDKRPYLRFLLWTLIPVLVAYLAMFPLVMIPQLKFDRWGGLKWVPVLDYSFQAQNENADILVFGDSSAFLGIDPRVVRRELGINLVVLPNTIGSLPVTGEMGLRSYLSHNKAPKLIVFYFEPWNLGYADHPNDRLLFEGEEALLRHGNAREIAGFAFKHPASLLAFPWHLNSTLGAESLRLTLAHDRGKLTAQAHGHIDYTDPYGPLADCTLPGALLQSSDENTIKTLLGRYASPQTRVAVYLAPFPACKDADILLHRSYADLHAAPPLALPAEWFASDDLFAHILPPRVNIVTRLFIDNLRRQAPYIEQVAALDRTNHKQTQLR